MQMQVQRVGGEGAAGADVLLSVEVAEGEKAGGPGAHLQLGRPLTIATVAGPQQFEDLDEILARFAEPLVSHVASVARHRCGKLLRARACSGTCLRGRAGHRWSACMAAQRHAQ